MKIGNEKNYVEFNERLTFGTKLEYKKISAFNELKMDKKTGDYILKYANIPFEDTADFLLLKNQVTKIVENEKVVFDYITKQKFTKDTVYSLVDNSDNLDKVLDTIKKVNKLIITEEQAEDEKK